MTNATTGTRQPRRARQPQSDASTQRGLDHAARTSAASKEGTRSKGHSKTDAVIALLKRDDGATLDELIEVTGWLPHSARASLTGLRKKGHAIERIKSDGISRYAIVETVLQ